MDYYLNRENAYQRLRRNYLQHGKIIIAYDFDDTVFDYHKKGRTYDNVMNLLREFRPYAHFIVYSSSKKERYPQIEKYLNENNIPYDKINEDIDGIEPSGGKLYYNVLLDDRAGLDSTYDILDRLLQFIKNPLNGAYSSVMHVD